MTTVGPREPLASAGIGVRQRVALAGLSAGITAHQVVLMQVLGYVHWHNFAYMVVAVALLGFGAAGTLLSRWRSAWVARHATLVPWLAVAASLAMTVGLRFSQGAAIGFDLQLLLIDSRQWLALLWVYAWLLPAFLAGGLATSVLLTAGARDAGRLYFANLLGAGAGGLAGAAAVSLLEPGRSAIVPALLAASAGVGCMSAATRGRRGLWLVLVLTVAAAHWPLSLRPSQFKPVAFALELPGASVVAARASAQGWVQIIEAPGLRPTAPLSLNFAGELPVRPAVFIDGYSYGSLLGPAEAAGPEWWDWTPAAVGWVGGERRRVLLLETGLDGAAAYAVRQGASETMVVEPHRGLVALLQTQPHEHFAEWTLPGVTVEVRPGRHYLRAGKEAFDLILFPPVGVPGSAGLGAAREQFLITREAFAEAWDRLSPDGALVVTAALDFPVRHAVRLLATLRESLEARGVVEPARHLVAVRSWSQVAFVVERRPVETGLAAAVRAFCEERSFDPLVLPGLTPGEREQFNAWPDPGFFAQVDRLLAGDREGVYRDSPWLVRPPTDDRPWFSQFWRWSETQRLRAQWPEGRLPFVELGTLLVGLTLVQLLGLAVVLILVPLGWLRGKRSGRGALFVYYAALGTGFMFVEIGLMMRLHAWLGSPLVAAAVVLSGLLVFAGIGSWYSQRWDARPDSRRRVTLGIALLILLSLVLLPVGSKLTASAPLGVQVVVALITLLPMGAALGCAFPLGLRELERRSPEWIPWAWAINGCVSVVTPAAATLLGFAAGVTALFFAAAAAYVLASCAAWADRRRE